MTDAPRYFLTRELENRLSGRLIKLCWTGTTWSNDIASLHAFDNMVSAYIEKEKQDRLLRATPHDKLWRVSECDIRLL